MTSGIEHLSNWQLVAQPIQTEGFGPTVVLSPHPDNESLGCGGTMALLHQIGVPVQVIMVSDGSQSHPNSQKHPADKLRILRESETRAALHQLGMNPEQVTFLRLPDGNVPDNPETITYQDAVGRLVAELNRHQPTNGILIPWRRDPHRDHWATWQLLQSAMRQLETQPRVLEYPIW